MGRAAPANMHGSSRSLPAGSARKAERAALSADRFTTKTPAHLSAIGGVAAAALAAAFAILRRRTHSFHCQLRPPLLLPFLAKALIGFSSPHLEQTLVGGSTAAGRGTAIGTVLYSLQRAFCRSCAAQWHGPCQVYFLSNSANGSSSLQRVHRFSVGGCCCSLPSSSCLLF